MKKRENGGKVKGRKREGKRGEEEEEGEYR